MSRRVRALVVALVLCTALAGALLWSVRARDEWSRSQPYGEVRAAVANLRSRDIAAVVLDTPPDFLVLTPSGRRPSGLKLMTGAESMYRTVSNPTAISLLLRGLQEATIPPQYRLDRTFHVTLVLNNGRVLGPFGFAPTIRVDCFSPTFIKGLKAAGIKQIPRQPPPRER